MDEGGELGGGMKKGLGRASDRISFYTRDGLIYMESVLTGILAYSLINNLVV